MQAEIRCAPFACGDLLAGKYRVDHWLGDGGMGVVLSATDILLERTVAIKFLWPECAKEPEAAERFTREARAAAQLHSEHVTRVLEIGSLDDGSLYIVMERLQGHDLSYACRQPGGISPPEAVLYVIQAADAIAEAHARGIIHRDLKPANLFLARQPDGASRIKVLDFGVSKETAPGGEVPGRRSISVGSPLYMSPEQMRACPDVDARTDIWGLGIILYELLCGALPFEARTAAELSIKVLSEAPADLLERAPHVSPALAQIVYRCLSKAPKDRYQNVAELVLALEPHAPLRARGNIERCLRMLNAGQELERFSRSTLPLGMLSPAAYRPRFVSIPPEGRQCLITGLETTQGFKLRSSPVSRLWMALAAVMLMAGLSRYLMTRAKPTEATGASAMSRSQTTAERVVRADEGAETQVGLRSAKPANNARGRTDGRAK